MRVRLDTDGNGGTMQFTPMTLANGLTLVQAPMPEAPRLALAVAIRGGVAAETTPGMAKLASRLLLKGTERRGAEALARELDAHGISLREYVLADCQVLLACFLPREFATALDLLADVLRGSTFADFPREAEKLAGEVQSSLDHPSEQAQDLLARTLCAGHPYGHTGTMLLQALPSMTAEAVRDWYVTGLHPARMAAALVGAYDDAQAAAVRDMLDAFADAPSERPEAPLPTPPAASRIVTEAREDAQQAQVLQGWFAPASGSALQAPFTVLQTVMGSGMSSRLFVELRDKRGLAYRVDSPYLPMRLAGEFIVYIGTKPENVERAMDGVNEQVTRMRDEPITAEELQHATGRLQGTYQLTHETAAQCCMDLVVNQVTGLGPDFTARLLDAIAAVTVEDVQRAAQELCAPSITAVVGPVASLPA
jgi:predicted Zn-dependent peptidase